MQKKQSQSTQNVSNIIRPEDSPLGLLVQNNDYPDGWLYDGLSDVDSIHMFKLCEYFAQTVCDGRLEAAMAMLAGCPSLAKLPCRKAHFSALHWSCSIVAMAPLTQALLFLGCDPEGFPFFEHEPASERKHNSPIRWAVSSGNQQSLKALLSYGAQPEVDDLYEACRNAQGACAIALVAYLPQFDPFAPIGPSGQTCYQTLLDAAHTFKTPLNEHRLMVQQALSLFEFMSITSHVDSPDSAADTSNKRL